jgi:hypothetical protein
MRAHDRQGRNGIAAGDGLDQIEVMASAASLSCLLIPRPHCLFFEAIYW